MKFISYKDLIYLNERLKSKNLPYKIHMHDACGSQSFSIESLSDTEIQQELYPVIEEFFNERKIELNYNQNKTEFWTKR